MTGSIAMSSLAALRVGAGLVTAAVPDRCLETVAAYHPCVMTRPVSDDGKGRFSLDAAEEVVSFIAGATAIAAGPGMTVEPGSLRIVERLLGLKSIPRVLDADALNALSELGWPDSQGKEVEPPPIPDHGPLVLTPHPGEFERLSGVSSRDRRSQIEAAQQVAEQTGVVVVLKGGPTVVMAPQQEVWTNDTGNPGMATAGSGDVLTGVIGSLLGQGLSPWDAARLGVWVHGVAGDLASVHRSQPGLVAADILDALPEAIARAATA
jgi:NAD(P)H-hydrate epimerase